MGFEAGTTPNNFLKATAGQTNSFWLPEVFSKKVQVAFRKSAVAEAICNISSVIQLTSLKNQLSQYLIILVVWLHLVIQS